LAEGSFGAFVRSLPLAPAGTPVVDCCGHVVREGNDPRVAAVVDIDVGKGDLQQCADSVLRMNAEWHYGRGDRDIAYPVSSGATLAYDRYLAGDRTHSSGNRLIVHRAASRLPDDHAAFRAFLDEVFTWANTASLSKEGVSVDASDLRPGDFFVMTGRPFGHAVLVLDVARSDGGDVALLLGQGYMPAQSFHVLHSQGRSQVASQVASQVRERGAWFVVHPHDTEVETPFWQPFPLSTLRRLP
jgi:hypothetical protein